MFFLQSDVYNALHVVTQLGTQQLLVMFYCLRESSGEQVFKVPFHEEPGLPFAGHRGGHCVANEEPAIVIFHVFFNLQPMVQFGNTLDSKHGQSLSTFGVGGFVDDHDGMTGLASKLGNSDFFEGISLFFFADLEVELVHGDMLACEPVVHQEPFVAVLSIGQEQLLSFPDEPFSLHKEAVIFLGKIVLHIRFWVVVDHVSQRHQHLHPLVV